MHDAPRCASSSSIARPLRRARSCSYQEFFHPLEPNDNATSVDVIPLWTWDLTAYFQGFGGNSCSLIVLGHMRCWHYHLSPELFTTTAHRRSHETSHWHRRHLLQGQRRSITAGLVQAAPGNRCPSLGRSCLRLDRRRGQAGCRHNCLVNRSARK